MGAGAAKHAEEARQRAADQELRSAQSAWLDGYALFRMLMEENGGTERWDWWPAEHQTPEAAQRWLAANGYQVVRR